MGCKQERRSGAAADVIGLRCERIDGEGVVFGVGFFAGGRGANRVRVIVDGLDAGDFSGYLRINPRVD